MTRFLVQVTELLRFFWRAGPSVGGAELTPAITAALAYDQGDAAEDIPANFAARAAHWRRRAAETHIPQLRAAYAQLARSYSRLAGLGA